MTAPYSKLCTICDCRFGPPGQYVDIELCEPCFRKYRGKIQDEQKFLKVECRAEREAVYSVFRRIMEKQHLRTI